MKFRVIRASADCEDVKPCDEAVKEMYKGLEDWFINLNTLDELLEFQKKYGDVIVAKDFEVLNIYTIVIYDDYLY